MINEHPLFDSINQNYVQAGLRLTRLQPNELFIPENMRVYSSTMESNGQPFEYLLYAKLTSGTTQNNNSQQHDTTTRRDQPTDRQTDGPTDRHADVLGRRRAGAYLNYLRALGWRVD